MSDQKKILLIFLTLISVLGIAAIIRVNVWPPEPSPRVIDPWEKWAESSTPECAELIRAEGALLDQSTSAENARAKAFLNEEARIESSADSQDEKEIALQRLAEKDDIKESKEDTDSTVSYMRLQERL